MGEGRCDKWRHLRLTLTFSFVVFVIILLTMALIYLGANLLARVGVLEPARFQRFPLFAFCLISIAVGTLVSALVSRAPLKPIRELMAATDRIADGDYTARIDLKGTEEFRALGRKFNHMAQELESVELLRSDFVSSFSHEFKTPISSIRGFANALKWEGLTPREREEYLDIIISESERLSALSSNVLYLSKLEKQAILTDRRRFDLSEQLRRVMALLDGRFAEKRLDVLFDSPEYFVSGNAEMLQQVWINLLDNAIKFSSDGGQIRVSVGQDGDQIRVRVSNQGENIPPEVQAHIFDKFYQGDTSHTTAGNGLGLSIVRRITELHGGEVTVRSSRGVTTFEAALLAPTAMNQQKFTLHRENRTVSAKAGSGFYTKIDLGIVKYHFELGAGKENFAWE